MFKQGYFTPRNLDKYIGDPTKIRFMSSWELSFNQFLDNNPNILAWGSEEIVIPYIKPTDGRVHKYYPDYYIKYKNKRGEIVEEIIEIKPKSQVAIKKKASLYEQLTYAVNQAKWEACKAFCDKHGFIFRILTEQQLFAQGKK